MRKAENRVKNQPVWSDDLARRENVEARFLRGNAARSGELLKITAGAQQGGVSATPLIGNRGVPVLVFLPMRPPAQPGTVWPLVVPARSLGL